jgi:hypothetical protein
VKLSIEIVERTPKALHYEMQAMRAKGKDVTLKEYLPKVFKEEDLTPDKYYRKLGINLSDMTVEKLLTQDNNSRWLFPEIFRDAIRRGLAYAPFYSKLIIGEETISNTGLTMPYFNPAEAELRDATEGGDITTGTLTWSSKQVTIRKKARGLMQTYESIMFTPIKLASIYFEDLGIQLGADLDGDLVNILINGDQADGSEAAVMMGVATVGTLAYSDIVRTWVRQNRMNRPSVAMLTNEETCVEVLNMAAFQMPVRGLGAPLVELQLQSALPSSQALFVHSDVPDHQIIFIDTTKAVIQLTAMKLMVESERIVNKQLNGQYASIITGFANVFADARLILDSSEHLDDHLGPVPAFG